MKLKIVIAYEVKQSRFLLGIRRGSLVERGMRLHPFLILLSILGGIGFFGPLGFLLGPLVLSLLFALFEIYFAISKEHEGQ